MIEALLDSLRTWLYQPARLGDQLAALRQEVGLQAQALHNQQEIIERLARLIEADQAERRRLRQREAPGLDPTTIDHLLDDFRGWLQELDGSAGGEPPAETAPPLDLASFLEPFTALRHEVHLQTRAVRAQQEQNAALLQHLAEAQQLLERQRTEAEEARRQEIEQGQRSLLKTLVDLYDALALAQRELDRLQQPIAAALDALAAVPVDASAHGFWQRWLRRDAGSTEQLVRAQQSAERIRSLFDSIRTGYRMSLERIDRALAQHELEPIACQGSRFDPEEMEVVEAAVDSGRPAGEVVEEVRRGYRWRGRVFRFAQVRVAK